MLSSTVTRNELKKLQLTGCCDWWATQKVLWLERSVLAEEKCTCVQVQIHHIIPGIASQVIDAHT
jgi:hypothetical protein